MRAAITGTFARVICTHQVGVLWMRLRHVLLENLQVGKDGAAVAGDGLAGRDLAEPAAAPEAGRRGAAADDGRRGETRRRRRPERGRGRRRPGEAVHAGHDPAVLLLSEDRRGRRGVQKRGGQSGRGGGCGTT